MYQTPECQRWRMRRIANPLGQKCFVGSNPTLGFNRRRQIMNDQETLRLLLEQKRELEEQMALIQEEMEALQNDIAELRSMDDAENDEGEFGLGGDWWKE